MSGSMDEKTMVTKLTAIEAALGTLDTNIDALLDIQRTGLSEGTYFETEYANESLSATVNNELLECPAGKRVHITYLYISTSDEVDVKLLNVTKAGHAVRTIFVQHTTDQGGQANPVGKENEFEGRANCDVRLIIEPGSGVTAKVFVRIAGHFVDA